MIEQMFYTGITEISSESLQQDPPVRRLTGMRAHLPGLIVSTARTAAMVGLALLLILGLLPVLAAQAAGGG
jgi:hypothetical protein